MKKICLFVHTLPEYFKIKFFKILLKLFIRINDVTGSSSDGEKQNLQPLKRQAKFVADAIKINHFYRRFLRHVDLSSLKNEKENK